jgi:hypothetical protein
VWVPFTQGAALGYVLLPLRGVLFMSFDTPSTKQMAFICLVSALLAWSVHFLLWQAAKPSGDKCTPLKAAKICFERYFNNGLNGLNGFWMVR